MTCAFVVKICCVWHAAALGLPELDAAEMVVTADMPLYNV